MIICAAISVVNARDPIIICGYRHSDCYETLFLLNRNLSCDARRYHKIQEGFLATGNRFLGREAALVEAIACGQLSSTIKHQKELDMESELYSEDLY